MNDRKRLKGIQKVHTIKLQIIQKMIISMLLALLLSIGSLLLCFVWMEHALPSTYNMVMEWYNTDTAAGAWIMAILFIQFMIHTFWIFLKFMNEITDTISAMSEGVHSISKGALDTRIAVDSNNELGNLARDMNQMAGAIQASVDKEKQWNQERYNMITNMSHDLKTPMMSMIGYADLIREKRYQNEAELEQYCSIVADKTKELNTVVNQLFQLSKISSSDFQVKKVPIQLLEFTQQVLMTFIPKLEEVKMEYSFEIPIDMQFYTDPDMMRHIYDNLISNTIKYAEEGHFLRITARQDGQETWITFENHGPMIPKMERDEIFQRFYREKKNLQKEGSGCGLYIVKQMTELLGGEITVQSSEKETQFILHYQ